MQPYVLSIRWGGSLHVWFKLQWIMGVMMFYEDSICIMMQQPTITTISRWPVGPLPLLYSPGTCTHCRRPLLLPVSSTAATISPPTLLSHIDLWIMKARQLIKDRMSSWWLFNPCETSCLSTSTSSSIFESMYIYIHTVWEMGEKKGTACAKNAFAGVPAGHSNKISTNLSLHEK